MKRLDIIIFKQDKNSMIEWGQDCPHLQRSYFANIYSNSFCKIPL